MSHNLEVLRNDEMNKKLEIEEDLYFAIGLNILNGSLQDVAKNILSFENELKATHRVLIDEPNKYSHFKMRIVEYYGEPEIQLSGVRMETDAEYDKRMKHIEKSKAGKIAAAQKRKENKEKEELETLKRLQEKYKDKL